MKSLLKPSLAVDQLDQIDPAIFTRWGVRGVIVDLDNTLLPWDSQELPESNLAWIARVKELGFHVCLLSNNHRVRTRAIGEMLGVPGVWSAGKPFPAGFLRARRHLGLRAGQCVVIGDQLFTDVLGGNLYGYKTILVRPLSRRELRWTRMMRHVERRAGRPDMPEGERETQRT
jgi:HAD superfamily phosphatase (TIGR01668 family)